MNIRNIILKTPLLRELFFFFRHKKVNKKKVNKKIKSLKIDTCFISDLIISLTSYGDRLSELKYTLYSLVNQSIHAEKIIVNLTEKDFDLLSPELLAFQNFNVEFLKTEDYKSYKKLIPTLINYPNKFIVTADDDLYYPKNWLKDIWNEHVAHPNCIICKLTKTIKFNNNKLCSYNEMTYNKSAKNASFKNFILSGGGTLFPPNSLYKDVFNIQLFQKLCPYADDIWDWFMAILQGTKIVQTKNPYINVCYVNPYREYGISGGKTLTQINVDQNKNDEQFMNMMDYYCINTESLKKYLEEKNENLIAN